MVRPLGMLSSASLSSTVMAAALCTSTIGAAPETVIVSSRAPTRMSMLSVAVKSAESSMPSRLKVWKPVSVKVTMYAPGLKSTIRN